MTDKASEIHLDSILQEAISKHGRTREALIPILSEINEALGYIPRQALGELRRALNAPEEGLFLADSHLYALGTFYHMFSLQPLGRHVIRYCESAPCHVMGGRQMVEELQAYTGLQPGETSPDGRWSLLTTSCLGVCGVGPVFLVDDHIYGHVRRGQVAQILAKYR